MTELGVGDVALVMRRRRLGYLARFLSKAPPLLVALAAAVSALHSQTKEVEIVRLVITPITMGAQIMPHAHFAGTGGVLVVILGHRQCRVFTLNTNWGQYYNEDFISMLGKVEVRCGCWK